MKFIKYIKNVIQGILFVILLLMVFFVMTAKTNLFFGIRSYTVLSGSMEPSIHVGSIIYIIPKKTYSIGNIITFKRNNITVTHRISKIISKNGKFFFQTKGDANKSPDQDYVYSNTVLGKEIITIPLLGKIATITKTIYGFIFFIVLPILTFVGFEIWNIKEELEKEIEKKLSQKQNIT